MSSVNMSLVVDATGEPQMPQSRVSSIVFAGLDGLLTSFAVLSGAAGLGLQWSIILPLGLASTLANALNMGLGEWLSALSHNEALEVDRLQLARQLREDRRGAIDAMVEEYVGRGMASDDALAVAQSLAKYDGIFVETRLSNASGATEAEPCPQIAQQALAVSATFAVFGALPLLSYLILPGLTDGRMTANALYAVACGLTGAYRVACADSGPRARTHLCTHIHADEHILHIYIHIYIYIYIYTVFYRKEKLSKKKLHNPKRLCSSQNALAHNAKRLCSSRRTTLLTSLHNLRA